MPCFTRARTLACTSSSSGHCVSASCLLNIWSNLCINSKSKCPSSLLKHKIQVDIINERKTAQTTLESWAIKTETETCDLAYFQSHLHIRGILQNFEADQGKKGLMSLHSWLQCFEHNNHRITHEQSFKSLEQDLQESLTTKNTPKFP